MGALASVLRRGDDDDELGVEYDTSQGVVKRIPIEVKPRGKLGLRTGRSVGKPKGSSSLRSALSFELENPEVEKIRKDFEMYRLNKENEIGNMQKIVRKLETENRKLRAELQTIQKTCQKLREERDGAQDAEHQAFVRAMTFEGDRDKIQRQFKIFRETKESELRNLLKTRRDLESKLSRVGLDDSSDPTSRLKASMSSGNPGDWWTALESEPSLGSTTQLHTMVSRGPEFAQTLHEIDGPYINVNKDDWQIAAASLAQVFPNIPESLQSNLIQVFISAPSDVQTEVNIILKEHASKLQCLCFSEGRILHLIHMPCEDSNGISEEKYLQSRCHAIDRSTIFVAFLCNEIDHFTTMDYNLGHLNSPGGCPAIFCFKDSDQPLNEEVAELKKKVVDSGNMKLITGKLEANSAVDQVIAELESALTIELDIEHQKSSDSTTECDTDTPKALCGSCLWDAQHDIEEMEHLTHAIKSTCELGFEKYYERLNAHVAAPGPLPPLLICGPPGSGKSLLLAKWIELQQHKASSPFVLYHFVGSPNACTADSTVMIRRLTSQLMQYVTSPPALTCDPVRLIEEFPKWLEKVSAKFPSGLILVFDSADRLHNCASYLKWLLDPLPVDSRVIISVQDDTCPPSWRSWPSLNLTELNTKAVKELSRAEMAPLGRSLTEEQEGRILTYCRSPGTCCPLYVVLMANDLARCNAEETVDKRIDAYLKTTDCVQLYKAIFDALQQEYETSKTKGFIKKALKLIYASRNGLCDHELFELIPSLSWNFWVPVCEALMERHILTRLSGLLVCAHEQVRMSISNYYMKSSDGSGVLQKVRCTLRDYFASFKDDPEAITYRVADELPWINRQLEDRVALQQSLVNLCIFVKLYARGRCEELVLHWLYVGVEKATMAQAYLTACKQLEDMVGQFNGLITLSKVADAYEALGRYLRDLSLLSEALAPLQRALEIRETALDPDHPSVAQSLHQVAGLHAQQGKFSTAEALYKHALEIYEGAFGRDHFMVAKELDALAVLYQKQGKHELADPLHKRALNIRRQCRTPQCSSSPTRRGDTLRKRVLQPEGLTMGPDSPELARTLNEIGVLSYLQNNVEVSESFFKRALDIRERVLEADHPDVAQSMNNLAALYNDRKMYEEAEPLYLKALDIREKHFPNEHPNVVSIIKHLAMMFKKMKKFDKAEPMYQRLVDIREHLFDANHPSVATAVVNWAVLCSEQGDHSKAQSLYERALKIYEESLGPTHPRVFETLKNLALCKYEQGEYESAASIYKRATEMREADPNAYTTPAKGDSKRSQNSSGDALDDGAVLEKPILHMNKPL